MGPAEKGGEGPELVGRGSLPWMGSAAAHPMQLPVGGTPGWATPVWDATGTLRRQRAQAVPTRVRSPDLCLCVGIFLCPWPQHWRPHSLLTGFLMPVPPSPRPSLLHASSASGSRCSRSVSLNSLPLKVVRLTAFLQGGAAHPLGLYTLPISSGPRTPPHGLWDHPLPPTPTSDSLRKDQLPLSGSPGPESSAVFHSGQVKRSKMTGHTGLDHHEKDP